MLACCDVLCCRREELPSELAKFSGEMTAGSPAAKLLTDAAR